MNYDLHFIMLWSYALLCNILNTTITEKHINTHRYHINEMSNLMKHNNGDVQTS